MARSVRIITLPGVFQPRSDARLLAAVMRAHGLAGGARVLELFAGSGAVALAAAREGAREVTAVDVSRRALLTAGINARRNGVRLRLRRGDLFAPVAGERFDLILANPPYVPSADDALPQRGAARAWEGGGDGRALLDRLCAEVPAHLAPGGTLMVVQSSICGEQATLERLRAGGLRAARVAAARGPLGPLMRARAELLETRGLLAPGQREEQLLVLAAHAERVAVRPQAERTARTRGGPVMAELTKLESKLAEVLGLAMAAQGATRRVASMLDGQDDELTAELERMHGEARETEERCTQIAGERDGRKTAILESARATRREAEAHDARIGELVEWALPIQQRHYETVLAGSVKLAGAEDPNELAS